MKFYLWLALFFAVVLAVAHSKQHHSLKRPHSGSFRHNAAVDRHGVEKSEGGRPTSYEHEDTEEGDVSVEGEDVTSAQKPHPMHTVTEGCFNKLTGNVVHEQDFEFYPPTCMLCQCSFERLHCVEVCREYSNLGGQGSKDSDAKGEDAEY